MKMFSYGNMTYIQESIESSNIPAKNYDEMAQVDESDLDGWLKKIEEEWPTMPDEAKKKIIASTEGYIRDLAGSDGAKFFDDEALEGEQIITEATNGEDVKNFLEYAKNRISNGFRMSNAGENQAYGDYKRYLDKADWDAVFRLPESEYALLNGLGWTEESPVQDVPGEVNFWFSEKGFGKYYKYVTTGEVDFS